MIFTENALKDMIKVGMLTGDTNKHRYKGTSVGVGACGVDLPMSNEWAIVEPNSVETLEIPVGDGDVIKKVVDVIDVSKPPSIRKFTADKYVLAPGTSVLNTCAYKFNMPANVIGIDVGKSTFARSFVTTLCSPAEPSWHGNYTIEITNNGEYPVVLYAGQAVTQMIFIYVDGNHSYDGIYQGSNGVVGSNG
jgi:dCTP deaminase